MTLKKKKNLLNVIAIAERKEKVRGFYNKQLTHPEHELIYVDFGEIFISINKSPETTKPISFRLKPGDCCIIRGKLKHSFYGVGGQPFDYLNTMYSGYLPPSMVNTPIALGIDERNVLAAFAEYILKPGEYCEELQHVKFHEFLILLYRQIKSSDKKKTSIIRPKNNLNFRSQVVVSALEYLWKNYVEPLNAEKISRHAGVSKSYLRIILQSETQKNLREHLRSIRIQVAKRLLRNSTDNINNISVSVGYNSIGHFCNIFKKEEGMTPMDYAKTLPHVLQN